MLKKATFLKWEEANILLLPLKLKAKDYDLIGKTLNWCWSARSKANREEGKIKKVMIIELI